VLKILQNANQIEDDIGNGLSSGTFCTIKHLIYRVYQNNWSGFEVHYIHKYGEQNYKYGRNGRVTQQVYDTYLQMFDVCTLRHTAHIEAIVQFLPYSAQKVRYDGLHSRGNSVLQIRYAHGLWWHKHFVLHVTPKEVFYNFNCIYILYIVH